MLFDSGASHSFVTSNVVDELKLVPPLRSSVIFVTTPIGDSMWSGKLFQECPIQIAGQELLDVLYPLI